VDRNTITINSSKGSYKVVFLPKMEIVNEVISTGDFVVIDRNVYNLGVIDLSNNAHFIVDASEGAKSFENLAEVASAAQASMRKNSTLVCIGGGITQDIAGFISSVLFRGVEWVFIPTTLLSQADSCIGGKTSINLNGIKNQLGGFHPPKEIYVCSEFLNSLDPEDIASGLGEAMHLLLVHDPEAAIEVAQSVSDDRVDMEKLAYTSLSAKKNFIELDEFDKKERLLLNYGHTFGHALEAQLDISHGRAVAFGMVVSNTISEMTGLCKEGELAWVNAFLRPFYSEVKGINVADYLSALKKDKKNVDDQLTCVLSRGVGDMLLQRISYDTVALALDRLGLWGTGNRYV
jgi:3-dehydroquinate synthase